MGETPAPRQHFETDLRQISRWEASVQEQRLLIPFAFALLLFGLAFLFDTPLGIVNGMLKILSHPGNLLSDYLVIGGFGAAFFNVGLMTSISILMVKINQVPVSGAVLAAIFTISGFSFFGKNLFNSIPITLGVYLFSLFNMLFPGFWLSRGIHPHVYFEASSVIIAEGEVGMAMARHVLAMRGIESRVIARMITALRSVWRLDSGGPVMHTLASRPPADEADPIVP